MANLKLLIVLLCLSISGCKFGNASTDNSTPEPEELMPKNSEGIKGFEGIGNFKLGKTTIAVIKEIEDSIKTYPPEEQATLEELLPDTIEETYNLHISYCNGVRVFHISSLVIGPINVSNIHLTFYKDTLVEFKCRSSIELIEALTAKYGKPTRHTKEYASGCPGKMDKYITKTWQGENFVAEDILSAFYVNCALEGDLSLELSNKQRSQYLYECHKKAKKEWKAKKYKSI